MNQTAIENIRHAVDAARQVAHQDLSRCDIDDIDELTIPLERELDAHRPNPLTLATYLNSLARSLRADPAARKICLQLDAVMRDAGIPTDWETR